MKKILFLGVLLSFFRCPAEPLLKEAMLTIDSGQVKIKYVNFAPKNIDKACLVNKIEALFTVLSNEKKAREMEKEIPSGKYFSQKYEDKRKEIKKLSRQILRQRHISTKGNHEWRKLVSSKHIVIEDEKKHIYIMYSLEPMMFIMSDISFEKIKEGETIQVRALREWIDMKECFNK